MSNEENLELSDENNDMMETSSESDSDDYDSSEGQTSHTDLHVNDDLEHSINSDESDSLVARRRQFKYSVTRGRKSSLKKTRDG